MISSADEAADGPGIGIENRMRSPHRIRSWCVVGAGETPACLPCVCSPARGRRVHLTGA